MQQVVIWDFDWSLVDRDSDIWVIDKLNASKIFNEVLKRRKEIGWNRCIDSTLKTAHDRFKYTKQQVLEACWSVPINPSIIGAIKHLQEDKKTTQYIISDANSTFIQNFLLHHDMQDAFQGVYTNESWFDEDGALRVGPFCKDSHNCQLCPVNLCKGKVMQTLLKKQSAERVVYIGDGSGDFCPCSKLKGGDVILARSHYPDKTGKCPLLQKLEDSDIGHFQNGVTIDCWNGTESHETHPAVYVWKNQTSLAHYLYSLTRS